MNRRINLLKSRNKALLRDRCQEHLKGNKRDLHKGKLMKLNNNLNIHSNLIVKMNLIRMHNFNRIVSHFPRRTTNINKKLSNKINQSK